MTSGGNLQMRSVKVKAKKKQRGFTIPEVLLVVLVIGLITSAGTGLYVGSFKGMKVRKAVQDFLLTAQYARIMAMERQTPYRMELDLANQGFWLTTLRWDEDSGQVGLETVRDVYCKPVQFEGDVTFEAVEIVPGTWEVESTGAEQQTIVFSPNGTAQSAVVQIGNQTTHYAISISAATGRAKVYFGTAENVKTTTIDLDTE
jgi:prepilin-type N-terminal cleavage/methylation domain-containing protein